MQDAHRMGPEMPQSSAAEAANPPQGHAARDKQGIKMRASLIVLEDISLNVREPDGGALFCRGSFVWQGDKGR